MTNCLIVGDVPVRVVALVEQVGHTVVRAKLTDTPKVDGPHIILHVPAHATSDQLALLQEWLDVAADENVRAALSSGSGMNLEVSSLLFQPAIFTLRLLNDGSHAVEEAVRQLLEEDAYNESPKDDDVHLGRWFTPTKDLAQYDAQRQLSLSSKTMEAFLKQLRDAVVAMQTPFPSDVRTLFPKTPPWDPYGASSSGDKLPTANPSLRDVFRLHNSESARRLLHPGSGGRASVWTAPKLLIRGESGSGKTLVAELVRNLIACDLGVEKDHFPYVTVNCAALSSNGLTHELFGTAPNMFSEIGEVVGLLAQAAYGVAFLDEIGDLELSAQRAMLVFLQDGIIRPFGIDPFPGFVRIIAATNRDVPLMIERQQFRNDLNARFEFQVEIPSLRDREESERERLVDFAAINPRYNPGLGVQWISRNALHELSRRDYSNGNFRELETTVHTAIAKARRRRAKCIRTKDLPGVAESMSVRDSDAYVINIETEPTGTMIKVKTARDIARASTFTGSPILQLDDGMCITQYVVTREYTLMHAEEKRQPSASAMDQTT